MVHWGRNMDIWYETMNIYDICDDVEIKNRNSIYHARSLYFEVASLGVILSSLFEMYSREI